MTQKQFSETATDGLTQRGGASIAALAIGIAVLVTSELLPAGVLPTIATDIGVSDGVAGLAVAFTAISGAIAAPTIALVLPRADRRRVLMAMVGLGALANLSVALAPSFGLLLAGRFILGIAISGFWSFAFGAGIHAAPGRSRAVSTALACGVSVAAVVGVPVGAIVADNASWRIAFGGAAVLCIASGIVLALVLPSVPAHPSAGIRMMRRALRNRRLLAGLACILFAGFGNFAAYPYIRLVIARVDPSSAPWVLLAWGLGGVAGTLLAGVFAVRLRLLSAAAPLLLAIGLVVAASATNLALLVTAVVMWGFAFNMLPVAAQLWVARVEPDRTESAISLVVTSFQIAITVGAIAGGALLNYGGVTWPLYVGAVSAGAAAVGFALLRLPRN
jgi:predicted MFS family arabinose efflux permease